MLQHLTEVVDSEQGETKRFRRQTKQDSMCCGPSHSLHLSVCLSVCVSVTDTVMDSILQPGADTTRRVLRTSLFADLWNEESLNYEHNDHLK